MTDRLKDRSIIVTGAASGIGAGIALDLAQHGANVVIGDINKEAADRVAADIVSKTGGTAIAHKVDVTSRQSIQALIADTVDAFGRLDVIFNNAGIIETASYLEITEEGWKRLMDVNALGVLMGTQEAAKQMIAQGRGGKIINTASIGGKQGYPAFAHYCASKFAVVGLTQAAARAFAEHKITVKLLRAGRRPYGTLGPAQSRIRREGHHQGAGPGDQRFQRGHPPRTLLGAERCRGSHDIPGLARFRLHHRPDGHGRWWDGAHLKARAGAHDVAFPQPIEGQPTAPRPAGHDPDPQAPFLRRGPAAQLRWRTP